METNNRRATIDPVQSPKVDARQEQFPVMNRYRREFRDAPSYSPGRTWSDYAPAYRYGLEQGAASDIPAFAQAEGKLARGWRQVRGASRLYWAEARPAVMTAWNDARAEAGHG